MMSPLETNTPAPIQSQNGRTTEVAPDLNTWVDARARPSHRRAWWMLGATLLAVCAVLATGWEQRTRHLHAAETVVKDALIASVRVHMVAPATGRAELTLPATTEPAQRTEIHPRAAGYVRRWLVDLGQTVNEGQVLAEIETPDLEQDVRRAEAAMNQARASLTLAQSEAERFRRLMKDNAVSAQDLDAREAQLQVRKAELAAAEAGLSRVRDLMRFQSVSAPFAGVVTARRVEVGNLVGAMPGGRGMFTLEQIDTLRVFVDVPQSYVRDIKPGTPAELLLREMPGKAFPIEVARTAGALNPGTRSMRVELRVPNPGGELLAGAFVQIRFALKGSVRALAVPVTALRFGASGPYVAVVDAAERIRIQPVTVGRDLGTEIEVLKGLSAGERVVQNPTDLLRSASQVQVIETQAKT